MTRMKLMTAALACCGSGAVMAAADFGGGSGTNELTGDKRTHSAFDEITFGAPKAPQATHDIDGRNSGALTTNGLQKVPTATKINSEASRGAMAIGTQEVTRALADGRDMGVRQTTQRRVLAAAGEHGVSKTGSATKQRSRHGQTPRTTRAQSVTPTSFGGQIFGGLPAGAQQHFLQLAS